MCMDAFGGDQNFDRGSPFVKIYLVQDAAVPLGGGANCGWPARFVLGRPPESPEEGAKSVAVKLPTS